VNDRSEIAQLVSGSLIGDILFACVQIARSSRRQDNSRFLLCLKEPETGHPEKEKQQEPRENRIHLGKEIQAARGHESDDPQSKSLSPFNGT
jgi:hypothetical protein